MELGSYNFVNNKFNRENTEKKSLRSFIILGASGTFALQITSVGLSFLISILLARFLGTKGFGIYAYAIAWVRLLAVPATLGFDRLLVRNISAYSVQSEWGLIKGILNRADQTVILACLILGGSAAIISLFLSKQSDSVTHQAFLVALLLLPLLSINSLRRSAMQGFHKVVLGQLPETMIRPVSFIVLILWAYYLTAQTFTALWAISLNAAASIVALLIGGHFLDKILPDEVNKAIPVYEMSVWIQSAIPMVLISGMMIINSHADILMLGAMKGAEHAGVYTIANRGAGLITFFLTAVNAVLAPIVARLYAAGEMERLQRIVTKSARLVLGLSFPLALALIFSGHWFLMLFGPGFPEGKAALSILTAARLINAAAGSVGLLLVMTGHERDSAWGVGISSALNIVLNAVLIPKFAVEGAAIATSISMIVWNIILLVLVYKRLGINPTVFCRIFEQEEK